MVQIQSVASKRWAEDVLPEAIAVLSANPDLIKGADERLSAVRSRLLAAGDTLSSAQACRLWRDLSAINGGALEGPAQVYVQFVELRDGQLAVSAQRCQDGRYTSVSDTRPNLTQTTKAARRAQQAVILAHDRLADS